LFWWSIILLSLMKWIELHLTLNVVTRVVIVIPRSSNFHWLKAKRLIIIFSVANLIINVIISVIVILSLLECIYLFYLLLRTNYFSILYLLFLLFYNYCWLFFNKRNPLLSFYLKIFIFTICTATNIFAFGIYVNVVAIAIIMICFAVRRICKRLNIAVTQILIVVIRIVM